MWKVIFLSLLLVGCTTAPLDCPPPPRNVEAEVLRATDALCVTAETRHGMVFECIHRNGKQYRILSGSEV